MTQRPPRARARGGKCGAEPIVDILEREEQVIRLLAEGRSQHHIARELGISQAAVSKILGRVTARWRATNLERIHRERMLQLVRLNHVYREALAAWERSQHPMTRRRQRQRLGSTGASHGSDAEVISEESAGDPRYLEVARRTIAESVRLLDGESGPTDTGPAEFTLKTDATRPDTVAVPDPSDQDPSDPPDEEPS